MSVICRFNKVKYLECITHVCVYVCMLYMYVYMLCIYAYVCMYEYLYVCTYVCMHERYNRQPEQLRGNHPQKCRQHFEQHGTLKMGLYRIHLTIRGYTFSLSTVSKTLIPFYSTVKALTTAE